MKDEIVKKHKEPFVRIAKRTDISPRRAWIVRIVAILLALFVGGVIISSLGHNPFSVYGELLKGSLASPTARRETIKTFVPLLGAAIAIAPAFKMKFWNIGAEGQILAGAIGASYFALFHSDIPHVPLLIIMFIAAAVCGAIVGVIPALFKARWETNETLFTLMLNYIILGIVKYLMNGPWKDPTSGFPKIAMFEASAKLPKVLGVHIGWIIVLVFAVLMFFYMTRSKQGYEIAVVGESEKTAKYAGMNVSKIIIRTMIISGAIAGIIGFFSVAGANYTLNENTAGGVGFTAITVAWLAKLNPFVMIGISFGLSILTKGSNTIQTAFKIPKSVAEIITGMILLFILGCEFFINYRLVFRSRKGE
ncbi:MAG: ABC transporter permease [Firmicutes bacterium]|nr:ABC transporter permease [Bacillota bacterium]